MDLQTSHSRDAEPGFLRQPRDLSPANYDRGGDPTDNIDEKSSTRSIDDNAGDDIEKDAALEPQVDAETLDTVRRYENDLVEFDGPNDPGNPRNWSRKIRLAITASMGMMTFVVTFASSILA